VLLVGEEGSGLTQIARWAAEYYSRICDPSHGDSSFCFICTPETTITDWIGRFIPVAKPVAGGDIIVWQHGPLTKAVIEGYCGVMDSIDAAPAKVSERLNGLLDPKETASDMFFDIPENSKEPRVDYHRNFRLIATCTADRLEALSPALLNRFNVVYLDNQLEDLGDLEKQRFMSHIFRSVLDSAAVRFMPTGFEEALHMACPREFTVAKLAKFCRTAGWMIPFCEGLTSLEIVTFVQNLMGKESDFDIPLKLHMRLLARLNGIQSPQDEPFYFRKSLLENLMVKLLVCSITRTHVCLVGPTGLGKTSMATAFSEISAGSEGRTEVPYELFAFNMETKIEDIYGSFSIVDGQPCITPGSLYRAMEAGSVFIADEFNLAEENTTQSLAVSLEPSTGGNVLIPGLGDSVKFHDRFMFIACQNDVKTVGRKALPQNIAKRLRFFDYPRPSCQDLILSCQSIAETELSATPGKVAVDSAIAEAIATFMHRLNEKEFPYLALWSMRDVRKLFRRIGLM
jgi:MoxR-like ATPase